jgi:hypothetical protein
MEQSIDGATLMHEVMILARWMARMRLKAEWKSQGRKVQYIEAREITEASRAYLVLHRNELMKEAWEHPYAKQVRHQEHMRLARKAVIAEIRDKGRKVKSIAPAELEKLIQSYLREHPWENAIREIGCV